MANFFSTHKHVRRLVVSALFLAIGIVLPFLTGQIKEIGDTLLPMHLPVMLCGLICGWKYGAAVGAMLPFVRSALFGMPPIYPNAVWMAAELMAYGAIIGLVYAALGKQRLRDVYIALVSAMLGGRVVWGLVKALLLGVADKPFPLSAFLLGGFVDAAIGIVLQLLIIPPIMALIQSKRLSI